MRIILIGHRSVGKTTVGKLLAKKLKVKYIDFDSLVEKELGGILKYFKKNGSLGYRKRESSILSKLKLPKNVVMSIGGGTVASQYKKLSEKNAKFLKKLGKLVYLHPSKKEKEAIKIIFEREMKRKGDKNFAETKKLIRLRTPIYEKIHNIKITIKRNKPNKIAEKIVKIIS